MILGSFMTEYAIELYGKNVSSEPDCVLYADTNTIEKAAIEGAQKLEESEFIIGYKEVWNAKIKDPKGEDYPILVKGAWTINPKTGKKLDSLEGKLGQNR